MTFSEVLSGFMFVCIGVFLGIYPAAYVLRVAFIYAFYKKNKIKFRQLDAAVENMKTMIALAIFVGAFIFPAIVLACIYLESRFMLVGGVVIGLSLRVVCLKQDKENFVKSAGGLRRK